MILDLMNIPEQAAPQFKGGEGTVHIRAHADGLNRIMLVRIPAGCSIGMHTHETNSEIMRVLSGSARIEADSGEELLQAGQVHYCPKGHAHATFCAGDEDLLLFAVVCEQ